MNRELLLERLPVAEILFAPGDGYGDKVEFAEQELAELRFAVSPGNCVPEAEPALMLVHVLPGLGIDKRSRLAAVEVVPAPHELGMELLNRIYGSTHVSSPYIGRTLGTGLDT